MGMVYLDADNQPVSRKSEAVAERIYTKILHEASLDFQAILGNGFDPYDLWQDASSSWGGGSPYMIPPWYRTSQKRGEFIPVFLNWNQLRMIRDRQRKLCVENPFAQCAIENYVNYCVGEKGLLIKAVKAHKDCPDSLIEKVQKVLDLWQEANELPELEQDLVRRGNVEGEGIERDFEQKSGLLIHRVVEPEHVYPPQGDAYDARYSFGVETDPHDVQNRIGYWIIEDPMTTTVPEFTPAEEVMHLKWTTPPNTKRGLSLFYSCELLLRYAYDLLRGVVTTANLRARYAVIRKFTGPVVKDAVSKMLDELNTGQVTDPFTNQALNIIKRPFGSEVTVSSNQDLTFPSADLDSTAFMVALQMVLRAVAARANMPEWMLSADASNANFSSTLISEAPSTKSFGRVQEIVCKRIGVNKAKGKESLAWRQVVAAVRRGVLPRETLTLVALSCEGPSLVVRDKSSEAMTNNTYVQMRIKPPQMIQQELGIDPKKADAMWEEWDKKEETRQKKQQLAQTMQGVPPQPGDQQPPNGDQQPPQGPAPFSEDTDGGPAANRAQLSEVEVDSLSLRLAERLGLFTALRQPATLTDTAGSNDTQAVGDSVRQKTACVESLDKRTCRLLREAGFTGLVTDKAGHKHRFVQGKQVSMGNQQAKAVAPKTVKPDPTSVAYGRPTKPDERHKNVDPPKKPFRNPPPPQGQKGANKAGGMSANGMTNTAVGDAVEELVGKLGLRSILPPGRRSNRDVKMEGSSLDREYDHSGWAFEVKACTVNATEYKAKPKKSEVEDKIRFAKKHKLKPATMIAVVDYANKVVHAYWRPGIGAYALTETNASQWNYMGSVKMK